MHKLKMNDDDDQRAGTLGEKTRGAVQSLVNAAMRVGSKNAVHAMLISTMAANGLLHNLAKQVSPEGSDDEPLTSGAILFAALLAYRYAPVEVRRGYAQGEFSPLVIADAIKDYEKLVGQAPDEFLNKTMCRVARECAQSPEIAAQVAAGRAAAFKETGRTLN